MLKNVSLDPSCSPCGLQGPLEESGASCSDPASLDGGVEPADGGTLVVNDTGPPELPGGALTPSTRKRLPPGPKPQSRTYSRFINNRVMTCNNPCLSGSAHSPPEASSPAASGHAQAPTPGPREACPPSAALQTPPLGPPQPQAPPPRRHGVPHLRPVAHREV